ncbi:MAG TPA: cell envelope integrity protein TolA [Bryobacteraceae bacterium]|nr:cell envelope integrity protein TolA [Bryobacteraceae bacterium]
MTQHADILDTQESMSGAFWGAVTLHLALAGSFVAYTWVGNHTDSFGDPNAGGTAVGIEAVNSIPIPHQGQQNPLANDSKSTTPQTPQKEERAKVEKPPPDAVALKLKQDKKKPAEQTSKKQMFRPYDQLQKNQLTTSNAPQVSTPMYSQSTGSGRIGAGANTTLGSRFGAYAEQIQRLVAQNWRTGDVDPNIGNGPIVIATFDLMRDGSVRNLRLLQASGFPSLDLSVRRAISDASPFPPLPVAFDKDYAKVEFNFELKR